MRNVAIVGCVVVAAMLGARAAAAAPWCAWFDPYTYNCGFNTFQQCLDTIRGEGGYCARNVYEPGRPEAVSRPVRRYRKHRRPD